MIKATDTNPQAPSGWAYTPATDDRPAQLERTVDDYRLRLVDSGRGFWDLEVDGEFTIVAKLEEAAQLVEEAIQSGKYLPQEVADLQLTRDHAEWLGKITGLIFDGHGDSPGAGGQRSRREELITNIEAIATKLARMGWEIGEGGRVREVWMDRAQGRWIPQEGVLWGRTDGLLRVEDDRILEVGENPRGSGLAVTIDGRWFAVFPDDSVEEAKRYALKRAQALQVDELKDRARDVEARRERVQAKRARELVDLVAKVGPERAQEAVLQFVEDFASPDQLSTAEGAARAIAEHLCQARREDQEARVARAREQGGEAAAQLEAAVDALAEKLGPKDASHVIWALTNERESLRTPRE